MRPTILLVSLLVAGAIAPSALAKPVAAKGVAIESAWIREAPPGARVIGGYATFRNLTGKDDRLMSITTDAAEQVEIHRMSMQGGMMRMEETPDLPLPAHAAVALKPGDRHFMLMHPKRPLRAGMKVPMTFAFARAGKVRLDVPVRKVDE